MRYILLLLFLWTSAIAGEFGKALSDTNLAVSALDVKDKRIGTIYTCDETANLDSIKCYVWSQAATIDWKAAVYQVSDNTLVDSTTHLSVSSNANLQIITLPFVNNAEVTGGTKYYLTIGADLVEGTNYARVRYLDPSAGDTSKFHVNVDFTVAWAATETWGVTYVGRWVWFRAYTTSAQTASPIIIMTEIE